MIFGHDPSFTEFAAHIIPDFTESIPKAGVVVIDLDRKRWSDIRAVMASRALRASPGTDVQKRMDEDVLDRLVAAIRQGIITSTRDLDLASSSEVTRSSRAPRPSWRAISGPTPGLPRTTNPKPRRAPRRAAARDARVRAPARRRRANEVRRDRHRQQRGQTLLARVIEESHPPLFKKEVLVRMPLRLGDDAFGQGRISADKAHRLVEAMTGFRHLIQAYPALDFAAYATSAMREASNGEAVVKRVEKVSGIPIEVIDGAREAEVIYENHVEHRLDPRRNYLYVDVGGGSTEVSFIAKGRLVGRESFPLGGVRALRGKIDPQTVARLRAWIETHRKQYGDTIAIGSGGNINTIYKMARVKTGKPLDIDTLRALRNTLRSYSLEERIVTSTSAPTAPTWSCSRATCTSRR
jgi:exopolyphosphatase/guanosine-5'-triphosphate,3'-diphosphate pyrophosphatase